MTPSRRHLFALLGLVLPIAAFSATPAAATTSNAVHHKSHAHHASASHKAPHHSSMHHASHHTTPPRAEAYRKLTAAWPRAFASSSARSPARMRSGVGGQPLINRSTGNVVPTPPVTA